MNLRNSIRDTDPNTGSSDGKRPRSFASRLLHFGLGGHGTDHLPPSPVRENSRSASSSSHDFDAMSSSISTVHSTSHSNDGEGESSNGAAMQFTEYGDTSQATREAMDTNILPDNGSSDTAAEAATARPAMQRQHSAFRRPVQLLDRHDDTPKVLTATIAEELRQLLPVQQRLSKSWRLVYSMDQQGISMNTMLALCSGEREMLLAIKDTKGKVFGAFLNEPLRLSPTFYGQGTCFLWKAYRSSPQSRKKDAVKRFKYTGENEYFILCDPDFVAIGGGRGKFGLWFKSDFLHGYSAQCPTFNNEPLCLDPSSAKTATDDQKEFVVGHLELWAFDS
ncbi:oxidation resistance protein 1 [Coemansia interrupta]|uniref:Oxidation resistance protein 1 n=1 Tax=Coemansia interrupta TaxID=1126814 RepID=A0A9W8HEV2_9FUNG|nr:oxidation resistance protein 1 [Coemansia interrupta]